MDGSAKEGAQKPDSYPATRSVGFLRWRRLAELKFPYKNYGPGIYRPVVPITITRAGHSVQYEVLIDSGADMNIFDAELADILGFEVTAGRREEVHGITGNPQVYYVHPVTITIGGTMEFKTEAGFFPNMGGMTYGVVGQKGFFEFVRVTFDRKKQRVEIK